MARHNNKGRSKGEGQFFALPYAMAKHEAWRNLSGGAVKVFIELRCRYQVRGDGDTNNNGEITLSLDEAARLLKMGKATVHRALKELQQAGFIQEEKRGRWYGRKATEWSVADKPCKGKLATRAWQGGSIEKQKSVPRPTMYDGNGSIRKPNGSKYGPCENPSRPDVGL